MSRCNNLAAEEGEGDAWGDIYAALTFINVDGCNEPSSPGDCPLLHCTDDGHFLSIKLNGNASVTGGAFPVVLNEVGECRV